MIYRIMNYFYAVAKGHKSGVFTSWNDCKINIDGFPNPLFKKFDNLIDATNFIDDFNNNLYVYTDGACIHNGTKNAKAGIGIFFNKDNPNNLSKQLDNFNGNLILTNNIAELSAIIEAINIIKNFNILNKIIVTDSEYAIKCATSYGQKLQKKNWKSSKDGKIIPNLDLIKKIFNLTNEFNIQYKHINAHTGKKDIHSIGNYYADLLANQSINNLPSFNISSTSSISRIYLNVPYSDKDYAKSKGCRWDVNKKSWFLLDDNPNKSLLISKFK